MFSRIPNLRIHDFFFMKFFLFSFKTIFSIEIRNVAKTLLPQKKTLCSSFRIKQDSFREKNSWIRKFGIRENMS